MARGNNGRPIVRTDEDRVSFYEALERKLTAHQVKLFAHALMTNHYHLLLETPFGNLSEFMKEFGILYVQNFKRRHKHRGCLYQDRFKAILVQRDEYFLAVLRYIHRNPQEAGIVEKPEDYAWSSYAEYLRIRPARVTIDHGMAASFLPTRFEARFRELHEQDAPELVAARMRGFEYYGSEEFAREHHSQIERRRRGRAKEYRFTFADLDSAVRTMAGRGSAEILQSRRHQCEPWKGRIVHLARMHCGFGFPEMAMTWGVKPTRLSKIHSAYMKTMNEPSEREEMRRLERSMIGSAG